MDKLLNIVFAAVVAGVLLFSAAVLSTVFGAICGWVVGLTFNETSFKVLEYLGIQNFEMWEIGAALGFVGSFFHSNLFVQPNNC